MLASPMNADLYDSETLTVWHTRMSDCLRAMDAPWQSTINRTNYGYDTWFRIYLQYVDKLND